MAANIRQISRGWDVYGSDGTKVGDVAEVGTNYFLVQKGLFFTTDYYIPASAIASAEQDEVRLNLPSAEIANQGWESPPIENSSTGAYTSGAAGTVARADATSAGSVDTSDQVAIPVVEENINVGTREVERGGVRVDTRVEETPVREQVNLRDEEVRVERRPVDQRVDAPTVTDAFREGTFEVRERDQQAVVQKEARVVEEVVVNKDVRERQETIEDTVRRTDVDVREASGDTRA
ncbi:MAG TPA: DUF2382 domain-containing protein [Herpetosiphonaceae bacterium]|nr:DUF2382 domain-containing protein [Herpetosiphonaceae bacterium]